MPVGPRRSAGLPERRSSRRASFVSSRPMTFGLGRIEKGFSSQPKALYHMAREVYPSWARQRGYGSSCRAQFVSRRLSRLCRGKIPCVSRLVFGLYAASASSGLVRPLPPFTWATSGFYGNNFRKGSCLSSPRCWATSVSMLVSVPTFRGLCLGMVWLLSANGFRSGG